MEVVGWEWVLIGFAALLIGMAKAGLGGLGMVAIVIFASVMPARESTGAVLTLLIVADLFAIVAYRAHVVWGMVFRLLPPAVVGILVGWWVMPMLGDGGYGRVIGWMTLGLLAVLIVQRRSPALAKAAVGHPVAAWVVGAVGGVATMLANAAGPVMTIYLLACGLPKLAFVGTAAWFFSIVNVTKVPLSVGMGLVTWDSLGMTLVLSPVVVAGGFLGRWVLGWIRQDVFEWMLIGFAGVAAVRLVFG